MSELDQVADNTSVSAAHRKLTEQNLRAGRSAAADSRVALEASLAEAGIEDSEAVADEMIAHCRRA